MRGVRKKIEPWCAAQQLSSPLQRIEHFTTVANRPQHCTIRAIGSEAQAQAKKFISSASEEELIEVKNKIEAAEAKAKEEAEKAKAEAEKAKAEAEALPASNPEETAE